MGSETSKAKRPAPTKSKATVIPRIPQDIIDEILDHLATDSDILRTCALVSKSWVRPCQRHLFHTVDFTSRDAYRWFKMFPVPDESPAHHVRELRVWIGGDKRGVPEVFFEYTSWFTGVDRVCLLGYGGRPPSLGSSFWKLPQSTTSLFIDTDAATLVQVRDILAQLPNLDDLSLSGILMDSGKLPGTGKVPRGRFGGRLLLHGGYVDNDVSDLLLEAPSGLRFTEVRICCPRESLPAAVRLAEACGETLVKFSYMDTFYFSCDTFEQSFDLSKFPNLQEVNFGCRVSRKGQGLPWISMALSTLRPATSPRLSTIRLCLIDPSIRQPTKILIKGTGIGLRRIADQVARIEREFEEPVNFVVTPGSGLKAVLDVLNILQHHRRRSGAGSQA